MTIEYKDDKRLSCFASIEGIQPRAGDTVLILENSDGFPPQRYSHDRAEKVKRAFICMTADSDMLHRYLGDAHTRLIGFGNVTDGKYHGSSDWESQGYEIAYLPVGTAVFSDLLGKPDAIRHIADWLDTNPVISPASWLARLTDDLLNRLSERADDSLMPVVRLAVIDAAISYNTGAIYDSHIEQPGNPAFTPGEVMTLAGAILEKMTVSNMTVWLSGVIRHIETVMHTGQLATLLEDVLTQIRKGEWWEDVGKVHPDKALSYVVLYMPDGSVHAVTAARLARSRAVWLADEQLKSKHITGIKPEEWGAIYNRVFGDIRELNAEITRLGWQRLEDMIIYSVNSKPLPTYDEQLPAALVVMKQSTHISHGDDVQARHIVYEYPSGERVVFYAAPILAWLAAVNGGDADQIAQFIKTAQHSTVSLISRVDEIGWKFLKPFLREIYYPDSTPYNKESAYEDLGQRREDARGYVALIAPKSQDVIQLT